MTENERIAIYQKTNSAVRLTAKQWRRAAKKHNASKQDKTSMAEG